MLDGTVTNDVIVPSTVLTIPAYHSHCDCTTLLLFFYTRSRAIYENAQIDLRSGPSGEKE